MKITNKKQSQQEINEQQAFQNLSQVRDRVNQNETVSSIFNRVYLPSGATFLFLMIVLNLIIGGLDKGNTSLSLGLSLLFSVIFGGLVYYLTYRSWKTQNQRIFMKAELTEDRVDDSHLATNEELFLLNNTNFFPDFGMRYDVEKTGYPKGVLSHVFLNNEGVKKIEISVDDIKKTL